MLNLSWNYLGKRYVINWAVISVLFFAVAIVMFAEKRLTIGFICLSVSLSGAILELFFRKALAKAMDLGKVKYNLAIDIRCYKKTFGKTILHSAEDEIEMYGLAIHRAKKCLKGNWKVTEKGYLIRGFAQGMENRTAVMDIDDVMLGLNLLEKVFTEKAHIKKGFSGMHLHFAESGNVANIGFDEKGLYLN